MKRRDFLSMSAVLAAAGSLAGCAASNAGSTSTAASTAGSTAASEVPSNGGETIKIICPYGVGGTADIVARKYGQVANQTQKKYNFIVEGTHSPAWTSSRKTRVLRKTHTVEMVARKTVLSLMRLVM